MGGEGACTQRVYTQTHTQTPSLHQRILHRSSRILQFATGDRDLQMHNYLCNRPRLFGDDPMQKNRGNFWCERRGGMRVLRFFSSLPSSSPFFRFLAPPHRTGACQVRPEATPPPGFGPQLYPGFGKQRARGSGRSCPEATTARRAKQVPAGIFPIRIKYAFYLFIYNL